MAVEGLARVVRRLQAKQASFAARVEECHSQPRQFVSCDDYLARVNGSSRGDAKRAIDTARRLRQCPAASAAFEQGDLSVGEASEIAAAVVLDPSAEGVLVAKATSTHDLAETKERARKVRAAARRGEDPAVRRARVRAKRRWSEFDDDDMKAIAARFAPEDWARIKPVVDAYTRAVFERARRLGLRDPHDAYRADGVLAALAAAGEALGLDLTPRTANAATANRPGPPTPPPPCPPRRRPPTLSRRGLRSPPSSPGRRPPTLSRRGLGPPPSSPGLRLLPPSPLRPRPPTPSPPGLRPPPSSPALSPPGRRRPSLRPISPIRPIRPISTSCWGCGRAGSSGT